jgi:hypothetical protein
VEKKKADERIPLHPNFIQVDCLVAMLLPIFLAVCAMLQPKMVPIGPAEIVWNQTSQHCPGNNSFGHIAEQPDSMPLAWHNPLTKKSYLVTANNLGTYPSFGPNLSALQGHDCSHSIYDSVNSTTPDSFANHQWLQVAHVFPNGSGAALIHSELHADQVDNASLCSVQYPKRPLGSDCQYWTTGVGVTSDGGSHWKLVSNPPNQAVFVEPRKYVKDAPVSGFGALGAMVEAGGFYYGHVNQINAGRSANDNASGTCAFRTNDVYNPRAYRGWNGSAWSVTWLDPYRSTPAALDAGNHVCATIDTGISHNGHSSVRAFAGDWRPEGWPSHLMTGWPEGTVNMVGYSFPNWGNGNTSEASASDHTTGAAAGPFTAWSPGQYLDISGWLPPSISGCGAMMYPSLLDHDSPFDLAQADSPSSPTASSAGLSYALVGNRSAHLYFIVSRKYIVRLPVAFVAHDAPPPPMPYPPAPSTLNPKGCKHLKVKGAGDAGVNGMYTDTGKRSKDGTPIYQKDAQHQAWHLSRWKLGSYGHTIAYEASGSSSKQVPVNGWGGCGVTDAPTVTCTGRV